MRLDGLFPNHERAVIAWLRAEMVDVQGLTVVTELPDGGKWVAPLVLIERVPGGGMGEEFETNADVDVTVFATSRATLWPVVQRVEVAMIALAGRGSTMVDEVRQTSGFGVISYDNPALRRAVATYRLTARPQ